MDSTVRLYQGPQRGGDAELLREMSILGTLRLEHVENFYLARKHCPQVKLVVAEDNEAVIKIIKKGRSAKLRHIHRTHRVDTDWLYENFSEPTNLMRYVSTKHKIADFNTKAITKAETWWHLMKLAQIRPPKGEPGDPGGLQASSKGNSGKTSNSSAKKQNLPTAACVDTAAATQWYECTGCDTYIPADTTARACMFCCPIRIKKDSSSEVEKRDCYRREEYYFDCQEPSSSKVEECVRVC